MTLQEIKEEAQLVGFQGNVGHINRVVKCVARHPGQVYECMREFGIDPDSIVREKIFQYISDKYHNGDYDKVYNAWLAKGV